MRNKKVLFLTQAAMIAALYVVLTFAANALGLANYAIQIRFSEALTILPFFTSAAIPGLFIGCVISNLLTGCMPFDIVFGSFATLIGAFGTYYITHGKSSLKTKLDLPSSYKPSKIQTWFAPLPPVLANTIIVPFILAYVYHLEGSIPYFMLTVGIGEVISCYILGFIVLHTLRPHRQKLFSIE